MNDYKKMLFDLPREEILRKIPTVEGKGVKIRGLSDKLAEEYGVPKIVAQRFYRWQLDTGRIKLDEKNMVTRSVEPGDIGGAGN